VLCCFCRDRRNADIIDLILFFSRKDSKSVDDEGKRAVVE
jgi:hypothetical protein